MEKDIGQVARLSLYVKWKTILILYSQNKVMVTSGSMRVIEPFEVLKIAKFLSKELFKMSQRTQLLTGRSNTEMYRMKRSKY